MSEADRQRLYEENRRLQEAVVRLEAENAELRRTGKALRSSLNTEQGFREQLHRYHEVARELAETDSFDALCLRAIELGRERLGFDRLGLWFFLEETNEQQGAFGVDEHGQIRDERHIRLAGYTRAFTQQFFEYTTPLIVVEEAPLRNDKAEIIGTGTVAAAALWDGNRVTGVLCADNLIQQNPMTESLRELMVLYAATIGYLCTRKRAEEQLLQAQKMESIGRLAGGIAHDFNNILTAILGYVDLIEEKLPQEHPIYTDLHADVQRVRQSAERAAALTRQLLAFARKQVIQPQSVNLPAMILKLDDLLRRLIGEDVEMITRCDSELGSVKADPGQLEQVLVNLAVNARDAMPSGGKLTIQTANVLLNHEDARRNAGLKPGEYVQLSVSDTGCGIDPALQPHIFEPFFTTKAAGRGTGLGLAMCYGIVKQAGGHISVSSESGQGTTFYIYLPRVHEEAEAPLPPKTAPLPRGMETILLAEDEPPVRHVTAQTLRKLGYTVLEAENGSEALSLAEQNAEELRLLITDVLMPQMSGAELAARMQSVCPQIEVLYISGYTAGDIDHHGLLDPELHFLQKPFTASALASAVRAILDAHEASPNSPQAGIGVDDGE